MILLRMRWGGVQFTHKSVGLPFTSCHKAEDNEYVMFFYPLCLSYLGGGTCVKWKCYQNSCFLLELVTQSCTRACCHPGLIWLVWIRCGRTTLLLEVNKCSKSRGQSTGRTNLKWPWLDLNLTKLACGFCHHCNNPLQAVRLLWNTLWEAQWAFGISPDIDKRQQGQAESK